MLRNYICYDNLELTGDFKVASANARKLGLPLLEAVKVQDGDGWVDFEKVHPEKGEMVELKIEGDVNIRKGILIECDVFNTPILSVLDEGKITFKEYGKDRFNLFKWRAL
jgi:hypothetical protein